MKKLLLHFLALSLLFGIFAQQLKAQINYQDSINLVSFYDETDGDNWTNKAGWKTEPVKLWYGIKVDAANQTITEINLPNNNLVGNIPYSLSSLNSLKKINLSENNLKGSINYEIQYLSNLEYLNLSQNQLDYGVYFITYITNLKYLNLSKNKFNGYIPPFQSSLTDIYLSDNEFTDMSSLATLTLNALDISNNNLTFEDLSNAGANAANYIYSPQKTVVLSKHKAQAAPDYPLELDLNTFVYGISFQDNYYKWFRNDVLKSESNNIIYTIANLTASHLGTWYCQIINSNFPSLTLTTENIEVGFLVPDAGKDEVVCYDNVWLYGNAPFPYTGTWTSQGSAAIFDATVANSQVTNLELGDNVFRWAFNSASDDVIIRRLPNLIEETITAGENQQICDGHNFTLITGTDPSIFGPETTGNWSAEGGMAGSPAFFDNPTSYNTTVGNLGLGDNNLYWNLNNGCSSNGASITIHVSELPYAWAGEDIYTGVNSTFLNAYLMGENKKSNLNTKQEETGIWTTDGSAKIITKENPNTEVTNLAFGENIFYWTVTNINGCQNIDTVKVFYKNKVAAQDSLALVALFDATAGNNWKNRTNWKKTPVKDWYGVLVNEAFNIDSINLSYNNLKGTVPAEFGNMSYLEYLDLSNNSLTGKIEESMVHIPNLRDIFLNNNKFDEFPVVSRARNYYNFNISYNNLVFYNFEGKEKPSAEIFIFAPQNPIVLAQDTFQTTMGSKVSLNLNELTTKNLNTPGLVFQWNFNGMPLENSANYLGVDTRALTITSASLENLGMYTCYISHPEMQELVLQTDPIMVKFEDVKAGAEQNVCDNKAQLNAIYPLAGTWTTYGNALIATPSSNNTLVTNLDLGANFFYWNTSIGVGEVIVFNNLVVIADAGADIETCDYSIMLMGNMPQMGYGMWTSSGSATLETYSGSYTAYAYNLAEGDNEFVWTITNNNCTSKDIVIVKNTRPVANAGNDTTIYSQEYPIPSASLNLKATPAPVGFSGYWSTYTSGVTLTNTTQHNTLVTGLQAGETVLQWVVKSDISSCESYDYITITLANHIRNAGTTAVWNKASDWIPAVVPTINDSVSISNCQVEIFGISAYFRSLHIGSGGFVWVKENLLTKAMGTLTGGKIVIEQDVEKNAKTGKGTLKVGSGGRVVIEQDVEKGSKTSSSNNKKGLIVGSGGEVVIEQDVEKGTKANPAVLEIASGLPFIVEETNPLSTLTAYVKIGNGGQVYLNQYYGGVKNAKFVANTSLSIGSGGRVVIEQDVEKGKAIAALTIGSGGRIVIEQDVEKKSKATTGTLSISGGRVVIEQDVEKTSTTISSSPSILIGNGGELIIEPNVVTGTLSTPSVQVAGGILNVGNAKKGNGKGILSSGRVVIEQDVEKKSTKATPDMTVFGNGILEFQIIPNTTTSAFINIGKDMALTFNSGSDIILPATTNVATIETKESSSVIDHAGVIDGNIVCYQQFTANTTRFTSPPVRESLADVFNNSELKSWNEALASWDNFGFVNLLNTAQGFRVKFENDQTVKFQGVVNIGLQNIKLKNTLLQNINKRGFNLIGNPFTAAIDWESVYSNELESVIYTYNAETETFGIYQKGGYSLNGADQYIDASEGFIVKALPSSVNPDISISQDNVIHNILGLVTKTPYKTSTEGLKLSVKKGNYSDQIMVRLNDAATMAYDEGFDAFKLFAFNPNVPQLYTLGSNNEELAINVTPNPVNNQATKTIALNFKSALSGTYTISVDEFTFTDKYFHLKDIKTGTLTDLRTVKNYEFEWSDKDSPERFQLLYNTTVGINDVNNAENFKIYSNKNNIYISVNELNTATKMEVYNISGTKVFESKITEQGISTFAIDQAAGNYFVKITSDKNTFVEKVFLTK